LTPLEILRERVAEPAYTGLRGESFEALDHEIEILTKQLKNPRRKPTPVVEVLVEALKRFVNSQALPTSKEAHLVCIGCGRKMGADGYRLIEDTRLFPLMLARVGDFDSIQAVFRTCYQALLSTYLSYDPDEKDSLESGRENWQRLRAWLRERGDSLWNSNDAGRAWVAELKDNQNVFADDPAGDFGRKVLGGDVAAFHRFRQALDIGSNSWLVKDLVLAQIDVASTADDALFKRYLPKLLRMLEPLARTRSQLFDTGLQRLLRRYRQSSPLTVDSGLRDFAMEHWGNPWLQASQGGWAVVDAAEREMVASWLRLHFIQYFFGKLAQEGGVDRRRQAFWERYHDALADVRFSLGLSVRQSRDKETVAERQRMAGLVYRLSGSSSNNAFIMNFGNWVVVEFSEIGNACYIFESSNLPFTLGGDVSSSELKSMAPETSRHLGAIRMIHRDRESVPWERLFEQELELRKIRPGQLGDSGDSGDPGQ
jgi:hypothetical protein